MRNSIFTVLAVAVVAASGSLAHALSLTGPGTATTLNGSLGTVDVVAVVDEPILNSGVNSSGTISTGLNIPVTRVQYDLLNQDGNASIFEFRVDYQPGASIEAVANPGKFIRSDGSTEIFWAGSNSATLLDSGFGTYNADATNFGSEWVIEYQADHVVWKHLGNGFFDDTATGRTDVGIAVPTFSIDFARGTPLDLLPARVDSNTGESAVGRTLSAVPEPATLGLTLVVIVGILVLHRRTLLGVLKRTMN